MGFLGPALIGSGFSDSGKVDEVKGHTTLLCTARSHPGLGSLSGDYVFHVFQTYHLQVLFAVYFP